MVEPGVLRGRRSGNFVLAATDSDIDMEELGRRAAAGPLRVRLIADDDLDEFIGSAEPVLDEDDLPRSGESAGRRLR
jgi:hypothetical protein